jgi:hypothetical protein
MDGIAIVRTAIHKPFANNGGASHVFQCSADGVHLCAGDQFSEKEG